MIRRRNCVSSFKLTACICLALLIGRYVIQKLYEPYDNHTVGADQQLDEKQIHDNPNDPDLEFSSYYQNNMRKIRQYERDMGDDFFAQQPIDTSVPILTWWTPFTLDRGSLRSCGDKGAQCFFTNVRAYARIRAADHPLAYLFYGTDFSLHDLPLPRASVDDWALLHEESPKNNYLFSFESVMRLFNHTATFRRTSDLPLLTQYLSSIEALESTRYMVPTPKKNALQRGEHKLAPVAYIQSDCVTPSDRDIYVRALMRHIDVDSYGACLHNKDLPEKLRKPVDTMNSMELYKILAQYKFVIAMENAVCEDYVTEKLWRSFYVGAVPLVYGSPSVRDILPDNRSAIVITDFQDARQLADYLHTLNANDIAYDAYLRYKRPGGVTNERLRAIMLARSWSIDNEPGRANFIDRFECLVCERVHANAARRRAHQQVRKHLAEKRHMGCGVPYTFDADTGALYDATSRHTALGWRQSGFHFSYVLAYIQQKLFFEHFAPQQRYNVTRRELRDASLRYYEEVFIHDDPELHTDL